MFVLILFRRIFSLFLSIHAHSIRSCTNFLKIVDDMVARDERDFFLIRLNFILWLLLLRAPAQRYDTFLDQTIFGGGFPVARHSNLIEAPFDTSTRVDGAT